MHSVVVIDLLFDYVDISDVHFNGVQWTGIKGQNIATFGSWTKAQLPHRSEYRIDRLA